MRAAQMMHALRGSGSPHYCLAISFAVCPAHLSHVTVAIL